MLMIDPVFIGRMARIAYLHPRKTPSKLVRCTVRQASRVAFSGSCAANPDSKPVIPALFTRMSSLPCDETAAEVTRDQSGSSRTSRNLKASRPPRSRARLLLRQLARRMLATPRPAVWARMPPIARAWRYEPRRTHRPWRCGPVVHVLGRGGIRRPSRNCSACGCLIRPRAPQGC
jgi:hypothetical protein